MTPTLLKKGSDSAKSVCAWSMYDWAISGFQTTVIGAILPIFFRQIACISLPDKHIGTVMWGGISAIAMAAVAIISLILGPISDYSAVKKRFLGLFTGLGILFTCGIAMTGPGDWLWLASIFILASIAASGSEIFYDSLLPHITTPNHLDRVSSRGYAMGYLGGGLLLAINIIMINILPRTEISPGNTVPLSAMQISFFSVALWWGVFSLPLFRHVSEPQGKARKWPGHQIFTISTQRLRNTLRDIRNYQSAFLFLLAFWFYNDGIGTVIKMATAYGDEIGIDMNDLIGAFLLVQFIGVPCTFLFGRLSKKIGTKHSILIGLSVYAGISIGGFFMQKAIHFWILAGCVGLVQGGTQALSRSLYARLIPKDKSAEFFGFFAISGKFAGIAGPVIFALTSQIFKNSRYGVLSLLFFFLAGGALLIGVPENNKKPLPKNHVA
ncbi:MFS transporter [bacterium]|nr:MFS transporter [bacterium]